MFFPLVSYVMHESNGKCYGKLVISILFHHLSSVTVGTRLDSFKLWRNLRVFNIIWSLIFSTMHPSSFLPKVWFYTISKENWIQRHSDAFRVDVTHSSLPTASSVSRPSCWVGHTFATVLGMCLFGSFHYLLFLPTHWVTPGNFARAYHFLWIMQLRELPNLRPNS